MSNFSHGVASYIHASATVKVHFPVDLKGRADVCCDQCPYYKRNYRACALNNEIVEYPNSHIGSMCPLEFEEEYNESW